MVSIQAVLFARGHATHHVQLRLERVAAPDGFDGGACQLHCTVVSVLRGDLRVGEALTLEVCCYVPPDDSPTGPQWLDYSRLKPHVLLDAYLNRTDGGQLVVASFQIDLISETDGV